MNRKCTEMKKDSTISDNFKKKPVNGKRICIIFTRLYSGQVIIDDYTLYV